MPPDGCTVVPLSPDGSDDGIEWGSPTSPVGPQRRWAGLRQVRIGSRMVYVVGKWQKRAPVRTLTVRVVQSRVSHTFEVNTGQTLSDLAGLVAALPGSRFRGQILRERVRFVREPKSDAAMMDSNTSIGSLGEAPVLHMRLVKITSAAASSSAGDMERPELRGDALVRYLRNQNSIVDVAMYRECERARLSLWQHKSRQFKSLGEAAIGTDKIKSIDSDLTVLAVSMAAFTRPEMADAANSAARRYDEGQQMIADGQRVSASAFEQMSRVAAAAWAEGPQACARVIDDNDL